MRDTTKGVKHAMGFQSLNDVLQEQLEDLHSAETQLVTALPKMAQHAHHDELRQAFEHHLEETREHLKRVVYLLTRDGNAPADARALQRENARQLMAQIKTAQNRPGLSKEARAHLADCLDTLDEALKAKMQRVNA